ncbi:MAG TPA: EF-P beta-lysylation protein EpmB [Pirellulaceae bacterium]|nr:EF-P beta-lysylation protein EpmB [Pirellulaceae bacterium]
MNIVTKQLELVAATFSDWQSEIKFAIRDPMELCRALNLPESVGRAAKSVTSDFALFAPRPFVQRIQAGRLDDPLLRQLLPLPTENELRDGFTVDAVGDGPATVASGVIMKYPGRALLIVTGACAIHCRYCFRRHFPYETTPKGAAQWEHALAGIGHDTNIEEIILSGGDPLMLTDSGLQSLLSLITELPHVRRVRVHTRLPIMIPARVTQQLVETFANLPQTVVIVIHSNHANELDEQVAIALDKLHACGCLLLNQSVLLRGVNDNAETLCDLSAKLIEMRVIPYYLHQLDRVQGASHFEVPIEVGTALIEQMRNSLPGYAVPRYVSEIPGESSKRIIM